MEGWLRTQAGVQVANLINQPVDYVTHGLVVYFDAANRISYPGSGTTIADLGSSASTGTLVNSVGFSSDNGGTLTFNGSNQRVSTGFKPSGERSYFIWVRYNIISSLPGGYSLTGTQQINAYNYVGIQNGGAFYYYAGNEGGAITNAVLQANVWYQQGFVLFSNGTRKLYVNGIEIASASGTVGVAATNEFSVGCVNQAHWVNGRIPVVMQYNRALSQQEITQNFNAFRHRYIA
jgi:hypothetical protein